ncbi:MAG: GspB domain-containing protein [Woeseia sp.]|jgi:general secretion pathway protein B|nr:GspB domain-containing protein [Woeseia sp.]MBT6210280.1 GspB domain-containing protein [Woeseia sp.]
MSFILDALKKSETERQQQNAPGFATIPQHDNGRAPSKWIWLVFGLLGINLIVLAGIYLWSEPQSTETVSVAIQPTSESATFSDMVSEAKRVQPDTTETDISTPSAQTGSATINGTSNDELPSGSVSDAFDTFNVLRAKGVLVLPDMHLDIHVFAGAPADRFIFVNMSKYKENAVLNEGPRVVEITPEGVILEHQNTTFLLPRQ